MDFFDLFQILSLVAFYAVFVGRTLMLMSRGVKVFMLGVGKKGPRAWLERVFMAALLLWSAQIVVQALHLPRILPGWLHEPLFVWIPAQAAGAVMISGGLALFVAALVSFGRSWRVGIDIGSPGALVTGGAFSLSRNPIFLFMDAMFISTFLINGSPFFLAAAAITVTGVHWQILQEERFLQGYYGKAYADYRAAVRRYI
ncbi:MAG: isoprenylcysteine carboxylmethyltransferase family protein [Spirochaetes bacterium]|nr:MAG: isoprenylcysteine carboxylmethyltransferase family protein [Spirochaetota bacterium]